MDSQATTVDPAAAAVAATGKARGQQMTRAYRHLRESIVSGRLAPGTRIVELDFATELGVSRTPVKWALQRLQQEGWIVAQDRRGGQGEPRLFIASLTDDDARELFYIVAELEGLAAHFAAALPLDRRTSLVERLRAVNVQLSEASQSTPRTVHHVHDLDLLFHQLFVDAGAGRRLHALHASVKPQAERYERLYSSIMIDDMSPSIREHEVIAARIQEGSSDGALRAVDANWRNAVERLTRVMQQMGERGRC